MNVVSRNKKNIDLQVKLESLLMLSQGANENIRKVMSVIQFLINTNIDKFYGLHCSKQPMKDDVVLTSGNKHGVEQ